MKKLVFALAVAALAPCMAFAQSAGSGGGAFSNAYLIPSVVCAAGSLDPSNTSAVSTSCGPTNGGGAKILFADIKVPSANNKDVLLMASLETSILTNTQVSTNGGNKSSSSAEGSIVVTPHVFQCPSNDCSGASGALVDCTTNTSTTQCATFPNQVTFNDRLQTLSATLGSACFQDPLTLVVTCSTPQSIALLLSTTSAHSFNFLVHNLSSGVYQIQLEIGVQATATTNSIAAGSNVSVGVGAGSLVNLLVQAQTPFDTITLCKPGNANTPGGAPAPCGP